MGRRRNKKPTVGFGVPDFLSDSVNEFQRQEDAVKRFEQEAAIDAQLAMHEAGEWTLDEIYGLEKAANELYKRDSQALNLYIPTPGAVTFHRSMAGEIGLVGSNRAGKSVAAGVEFAWAATGTHPNKDKYPPNNLEMCVVGPRLEHLSLLYDILCGEGKTFKVLKDGIDWIIPKHTVPEHYARMREWKDAPPLIPPEMILDEPSWYNKNANQPSIVRLTNGTKIYFFSFEQDPPRGVPFHLCLSKDSEIYDPVADVMRKVGYTKEPFHVWSFNESSGQVEVKRASRPFIKGYGEQLKVELSNGATIYVARGHEVLTVDGEWVEITKACDDKLGVVLPAFGGEHLSQQVDAARLQGKFRTQPQELRWSECDTIPEVLLGSWPEDGWQLTPSDCAALYAHHCLQGVQDSLFGCHFSRHSCDVQLQLDQDICQCASPSLSDAHERIRHCSCVDETASKLAHSLSCQDISLCETGFFSFYSQELRLPSLLSQQRLETRQVFYTRHGYSGSRQRKVSEQYLGQLSSCGTRQVSESVFQLLGTIASQPASLCRNDLSTTRCFVDHRSRVYEERQRQVTASSEQTSAPLSGTCTYLPSETTKEKLNTTNQCYVTRYESLGNDLVWDISVEGNHNYIYGGIVNHNCWMDEEARGVDKWLSELRARFISVMGRLIWSSTPESATPTFYDLKTRSERPDMKDKVPYKRTEFFELLSKDNPYLPPLGLEAASERLNEDDPEAASAKIDGEWTFRRFLVYPEFDEKVHVIDPFEIEWRDSCYAITDPGRTRCGTLFVVLVHPDSPHYLPGQPDRVIVFDELLIQTARDRDGHYIGINAESYAEKFAKKWNAYKHWLEDITFDWSQGRKKDEFDVEIMERYRHALEVKSIIPRVKNFIHAKSNLTFGIEEVSKFLTPQDNKPPKFVIMRGKAPQLIYEFKKYQREQLKGSNGRLTPGKPIAKRNELVDCTRYACCRGYTWVSPPPFTQANVAFTGKELARLANDNKAWERFMNRDFYAQFDRKPKR